MNRFYTVTFPHRHHTVTILLPYRLYTETYRHYPVTAPLSYRYDTVIVLDFASRPHHQPPPPQPSVVPLFRPYRCLCLQVDGTQWSCDLINFNATHLFAHPSYYAQTLLSSSRRATTLKAVQSGGHATWAAVASSGSAGGAGRDRTDRRAVGDVTLKVANYNASALPVTVAVAGRTPAHIRATMLTAGSPDAVNSLDAPEAVIPAELSIEWDGKSRTFVVPMPPWSVAVVHVSLYANKDDEIVERR